MKEFNVAVVGATGAVGSRMIQVLEERNFPVATLKALATLRSAGKKIKFKGEEILVQETKSTAFKGVDIALFAGTEGDKGAAVTFAKDANSFGAVVIDNGADFRMKEDVPLVVPEVNPEDVKWHKGIISNPNCSTIQMVVVLKPIYDAVGIKRVVVSTFQSVSGTGKNAIEELENQVKTFSKGEAIPVNVYPYQIAFNVLPHIGGFDESGYTQEELKMVRETRKIMHDSNIQLSATCVRVPVFYAHSEAINIETKKKISASDVKDLLSKSKGIIVIDDVVNNKYPLPLHAAGKDEVFVGRIREDKSIENGIDLWCVSDNLRKGAATNAVQIAELLVC